MYNINTHYTNIFNLASSIVKDPAMMYLHPHGATEINNIETIHSEKNDQIHMADAFIICYDQEPLIPSYNAPVFSHINTKLTRYQHYRPLILLNTELDSDDKDKILSDYNYIDCYYFHHIFAAHDWFRDYYYNKLITPVTERKISNKFISMNRLTSFARVYRTLLINELIKHDIVIHGHVSYSRTCPLGGDSIQQLVDNKNNYNIPSNLIAEASSNIGNSTNHFRIDFQDDEFIPNRSFSLDPIPTFMESFLHIVAETNYWGRKKHLTEKIFKPIILKQPFLLVGCAHNLAYLKSYGFRTFDKWWSEDYDNITDDIQRMHTIGDTINSICKYSLPQLEDILKEMQEVLDYNFNLFYSREFIDNAWNELETNLKNAISQVNS